MYGAGSCKLTVEVLNVLDSLEEHVSFFGVSFDDDSGSLIEVRSDRRDASLAQGDFVSLNGRFAPDGKFVATLIEPAFGAGSDSEPEEYVCFG